MSTPNIKQQTEQIINKVKAFNMASKQSYGFAKTYMAILSNITKLIRGLNQYRKIGEQKLTFEQAFPKVGKPISPKATQALAAYQNKNKKENTLTQVLKEMKLAKDDIVNVNEKLKNRNKLNAINYKKEVHKKRFELHSDILSLQPYVIENITKGLKILQKARRLLSPTQILFEHTKRKLKDKQKNAMLMGRLINQNKINQLKGSGNLEWIVENLKTLQERGQDNTALYFSLKKQLVKMKKIEEQNNKGFLTLNDEIVNKQTNNDN